MYKMGYTDVVLFGIYFILLILIILNFGPFEGIPGVSGGVSPSDKELSLAIISLLIISNSHWFWILKKTTIKKPRKFLRFTKILPVEKQLVLLDMYFDSLISYSSFKRKPSMLTSQYKLPVNESLQKKEYCNLSSIKNKINVIKNKVLNFLFKNRINFSSDLNSYIRQSMNKKIFADKITERYPYLVVNILDSSINYRVKEMVASKFLKLSMQNPNSALSLEIKQYEGSLEEHKLLSFFFADVKVARDVKAYKHVGDAILEELNKDCSLYNTLPAGDINRNLNDYPVYIGISFFDIMFTYAIEQESKNHMWPYYYTYFVKKICTNIDYQESNRESIDDVEFANIYERLIYSVFSNNEQWIHQGYKDDKVPSIDKENMEEASNIFTSFIETYISSFYELMKSNLRSEFKEYILAIVLRLYADMKDSKKKYSIRYTKYFELYLEKRKPKQGLRSLRRSLNDPESYYLEKTISTRNVSGFKNIFV